MQGLWTQNIPLQEVSMSKNVFPQEASMAKKVSLREASMFCVALFYLIHWLTYQKAYTSLGMSSMQILLLSAHVCMHFAWEVQIDTQCLHLVYAYRTNCNLNAYMHDQSTKEFGVRIVAGST